MSITKLKSYGEKIETQTDAQREKNNLNGPWLVDKNNEMNLCPQ